MAVQFWHKKTWGRYGGSTVLRFPVAPLPTGAPVGSGKLPAQNRVRDRLSSIAVELLQAFSDEVGGHIGREGYGPGRGGCVGHD
ncbi:MAG: hypothetical protein AAFX78_03635 [Cyanobacteria bacterium J06638_20]